MAAKKLIETGAKNIIHFRGPSDLITVVDRAKGFYNAIDQFDDVTSVSFDLDFKNPDFDDIDKFIQDHPDVDGIFCSSDIIAFYVISALTKNGYSVPDDVQVIGFDNIELADVFVPRLTTIAQPIDDFGTVAMTILKTLISKLFSNFLSKPKSITSIWIFSADDIFSAIIFTAVSNP